MNTIEPDEAARQLRTVADLLERAESAPLAVHLTIDISRYGASLTEPQRVAVVDAISALLGLIAAPTKVFSFWEHQAARNDGGFHLSVATAIKGPRLCACGAACAHAVPLGAAA
jgi:hypothetical protein